VGKLFLISVRYLVLPEKPSSPAEDRRRGVSEATARLIAIGILMPLGAVMILGVMVPMTIEIWYEAVRLIKRSTKRGGAE
jgi:uncharacterized BrkB/YihY/UPF0761 family membrane protein